MAKVEIKRPDNRYDSLRGRFASDPRGSLYMITADRWDSGTIKAIVITTSPSGGLAEGETCVLEASASLGWLLPPGTKIIITTD